MLLVARFSGLVTFSDGSVQQIAGHIDDAGNISMNSAEESGLALLEVLRQGTWVQDMLTLLAPGTFHMDGIGVPQKTVTSLVGECSGRIAYADGSWGDWIAQYTPQTGAFVPDGGSVDHFTAALADSAALNALERLFEAIYTLP